MNEFISKEKVESMAEEMTVASEQAGLAARKAITDEIDKYDNLDDRQKIGAMVTAATATYAAILEVVARKTNKPVRELAKGMYMTMVVPALVQLEDD